ncbi:hypothetical protein BDN72DRAFT_585595 [Pluteus cervinus]|uniref:Uncharacterized protein n=1 Tax=Pluteus cervinus TaxID=181527 RepID=A0ACD3AWR5_9AGAR|nr:hypothetical protein BDN72DRAFT_585595 [Pluteus cervinus]
MDLNINPIREQPSSLQGMGLHKCPALGKPGKGKPGFLDTVLPEIFISIFSLDNIQGIETQTMSMTQSDLSLGPRHSKIPTPVVPFSITADFTVNPDDKPFTKLRHMRDRSIMAIPRSAPTTRKGWDPKRLRTVKMLNKLGVDVQFLFKAIVVIVVLIFLWHVLSLLLGTSSSIVKWVFISFFSIFRAIFSFLFAFLWSKAYIPKVNLDAPVQYKHVDCPAPIDLIHTWELESFNLTSSGTPTALHYTLDLERAHRLSVIDADKRDTIMRIIVDDEVRGLTRDFELDKTVDCGVDNYRNCLKAHSAGFVIIEKGKHSVTVEYAGKEFLDRDAYTVNWEGEKQRRIFWKREKCGS